jgi:hypothetical protein
MDRRGRELFEVGHSRTTRRGAHDAAPSAPDHAPTSPHARPAPPPSCRRHVSDMTWGRLRGGDSRTSAVGLPPIPDPFPQGGGGPLRFLAKGRRPKRSHILAAALVLGLALGAAEEAARHAGYAPDTASASTRYRSRATASATTGTSSTRSTSPTSAPSPPSTPPPSRRASSVCPGSTPPSCRASTPAASTSA